MHSNKKAQAFAAYWIVRIILLFFVFVAANLIANTNLNDYIKTNGIEYDLITNKLLFSQGGISYYSLETGRVYPLIIDKNNFNENHINKSINITSVGMKLSLTNLEGKQLTETTYYNKETFDNILPLVFDKNYDLINKSYYVTYRENNLDTPGILNIDIVVSK